MASTQEKYKKNREEFEAATTTAIAPRTKTSEALAVAGNADKNDRRGKENIQSSDLILPRLLAAQKTSAQIEEGNEKYIPGLKLAQLFHSVSEENYGNGPVLFAIVRHTKKAIEFDKNDPKKVVDANVPWDDPRCEFGKNGEKPTVTRFYEFLIILADSLEPVLFSLKSTQTKIAKKLINLMNARPGAAWNGLYSMTTTVKTFPKGAAAQFAILPAGKSPDDVVQVAEEVYEATKGKNVVSEADATDAQVEPNDEKLPF